MREEEPRDVSKCRESRSVAEDCFISLEFVSLLEKLFHFSKVVSLVKNLSSFHGEEKSF